MARQQAKKPELKKQQEIVASVKKPQWSFSNVILLFAASFLLHTILNILVNQSPTVVIDEGLYTNIARSLAWEGKLAFRGQPVNYPYLLYPFLLVPIYWINGILGGDIYRIIQIFNTLLITSSVFPAYCFANRFTKDKSKSFAAALIVAIIPDMLMGGYEMTECLIWPLTLWMVYFCYRFYTDGLLKDGMLTALFTGLMFATKPGAVAAGAVMLIAHCFMKDKEKIKRTLFSILVLIGVIGVTYGIFLLLFGAPDSLLGLYTKQTEEWKTGDILVALEASFLLAFLFVFACGGIYGILPITHFTGYEKTKRSFILSFLLAILVTIIGTAVFVVPYKWSGELGSLPLHLRYCSMFIPIMYIFSVDVEPDSLRTKRLIIALSVFTVLCLFPGVRAGFVSGKTGTIDSITLDAFVVTRNVNGRVTGWILTGLVVACMLMLIRKLMAETNAGKVKKKNRDPNKNQKLHRIGTLCFIVFMCFNSICAHVSANIYIDPTISEDALEINKKIAGQESLGITQRYYDDIYSYWLESRLNKPMQQVTIDQMFVQMEETDGVYIPFTPVEQSPNVNNHETPDTDLFVLGMTIAEHMELNKSVEVEKTKNGHFTIARIQPSERWVDTMMFGLDDNSLYTGVPGYIHIFDESRNMDGKVTITVTAAGNGILVIDGEKIAVSGKAETFEVSLPFKKVLPISAENGTVQILGYSTQYPDS